MINPRYSTPANILHGAGGLHADGRWNLKRQFRCTYASLLPETALAEVLAASRRKRLPDATALPRTLVCLALAAQKTLDLTDGHVRQYGRLARHRIVGDRWWLENQNGREAWTQALGRAAVHAGFEALRVPSAAHPGGANVIVFPENLLPASSWTLVTPVPGRI